MESDAIKELQEQLLEAQRRAEAAEQQQRRERQQREAAEQQREAAEQRREAAEQEQRRERQQREAAEQQREAAERRAEASEQETQPTTLDEYLDACHELVFTKLQIEQNPGLVSKGSLTNPQSKWCPTKLQPWPEFLHQQRRIFGLLLDTFPCDSDRLFESKNFLETMGARIGKRSIADEKGLEVFLHNAVEDPVRNIVDQLVQNPAAREYLDLGDGIVFENHPHALSDTAEEVVDRQTRPAPPSTPGHGENLKKLQADQICIYRSDGGQGSRTRAFICEYKPPPKLTIQHLHVGLQVRDIYKAVVNRKTIPTSEDTEARFKYHAERLTASAITQTYNYMIEGGLEYSVLTTQGDDGSGSSDEESPGAPGTPSPAERNKGQGAGQGAGQGPRWSRRLAERRRGGGANNSGQSRPFCTQNCLLGLVRGHALDRSCPNVHLHCRRMTHIGRGAIRHPIDHAEWLQLLHAQLKKTLVCGITPLEKSGARGVLFKVTLLKYGYTFVSKGTIVEFIRDLEDEAAVYRRLEDVQGIHVPVFLGAVDLRPLGRTYYYDHRVYIVHLTLMSWGGESLHEARWRMRTTQEQVKRSLEAIHKRGVIHTDVRGPNILFCEETGGAMVIDFERAKLLEPRQPLAKMTPNKRSLPEEPDKGQRRKQRRTGQYFREDILMASRLFVTGENAG